MFKRIKVITFLVSVLLVLGIMQLISAGIFINALNNDKDNFTVSQVASQNVAEFTDAWISLNQARVTLNRGMLRLQSSVATQINGGQLNELVRRQKICWLMHRRITINTTRCPIPRGWVRLPKQLEEQYRIYSATLTQMNVLLAQGNLEDMFKQNAEQKQNAMQKVYREWRKRRRSSPQRGKDNESDYKRILWRSLRLC
jgi:methyl-accepting chemotaxis protein-1 (serine sensor receptor)